MPKTITVTNILRASYLADGSMVEMEFAGLNGEKFALRFSPDNWKVLSRKLDKFLMLGINIGQTSVAEFYPHSCRRLWICLSCRQSRFVCSMVY